MCDPFGAVASGTVAAFPGTPLATRWVVVAAALFPAVTWLVLVAWVYLDALARGSDHPVRSAATVAVFPLALLAYVYYRPERTGARSDRERLALTVLLALLAAMIAGTVFSPPDVFAQPRNTFGALLVTLPTFYVVVYLGDEEETESETPS